MYARTWAAFCLGSLLFIGCSKKSDDPTPLTAREKLVARTWKLTAATSMPAMPGTDPLTGQPNTSSDVYANNPGCKHDDVYIFGADRSFSKQEGATRCAANDPTVIGSGTWSFSDNETALHITAGSSQSDIALDSLTDSYMSGTTYVPYLGTTYTEHVVYRAQ